jgi:predicted transcriptional regulator
LPARKTITLPDALAAAVKARAVAEHRTSSSLVEEAFDSGGASRRWLAGSPL